jgi:hypothetical protein
MANKGKVGAGSAPELIIIEKYILQYGNDADSRLHWRISQEKQNRRFT